MVAQIELRLAHLAPQNSYCSCNRKVSHLEKKKTVLIVLI